MNIYILGLLGLARVAQAEMKLRLGLIIIVPREIPRPRSDAGRILISIRRGANESRKVKVEPMITFLIWYIAVPKEAPGISAS